MLVELLEVCQPVCPQITHRLGHLGPGRFGLCPAISALIDQVRPRLFAWPAPVRHGGELSESLPGKEL